MISRHNNKIIIELIKPTTKLALKGVNPRISDFLFFKKKVLNEYIQEDNPHITIQGSKRVRNKKYETTAAVVTVVIMYTGKNCA